MCFTSQEQCKKLLSSFQTNHMLESKVVLCSSIVISLLQTMRTSLLSVSNSCTKNSKSRLKRNMRNTTYNSLNYIYDLIEDHQTLEERRGNINLILSKQTSLPRPPSKSVADLAQSGSVGS